MKTIQGVWWIVDNVRRRPGSRRSRMSREKNQRGSGTRKDHPEKRENHEVRWAFCREVEKPIRSEKVPEDFAGEKIELWKHGQTTRWTRDLYSILRASSTAEKKSAAGQNSPGLEIYLEPSSIYNTSLYTISVHNHARCRRRSKILLWPP